MITINDTGIVIVHLFEVFEMWPCKNEMKFDNCIRCGMLQCADECINEASGQLIRALAALNFLCFKDLQKFLEKPLALF